ncbi:MAG: DUF5693 family protein [Halanaerobiales bacterium]|nr:DUF5693 family protein [Halanaerobiales bacterium]
MNKKILYLIIILIAVISIFGITDRLSVENNNKIVELTYDYQALKELEKTYNGQSISLKELKDLNINSIGLAPNDLEALINNGEVVFLDSQELHKNLLFSNNDMITNIFKKYKEINAILIFGKSSNYFNNLKLLKENLNLKFEEINNKNIVIFPVWKEDYLSIDLGFDQDLIKNIKDHGFNITYRLENSKYNEINFKMLAEIDQNSAIVFTGEEIVGYPDNIDKTAQIIKNKQSRFGFIEAIIAVQKGEDTLSKLLNFQISRVHSITQEEMNIYSKKKIVDRYIRAVKERNIRILYLRPIIKKDLNFLKVKKLNQNYLLNLKDNLFNLNYKIEKSEPFRTFSNNNIFIILAALGTVIGTVLLLIYIFNIKELILTIILVILGIIGIFVFYYIFDTNLFRAAIALGSSIIFPSLAIISQVLSTNSKKNILTYFKTVLITSIGALFVVVALSDIGYLTKIYQFRGVKLAFLTPLLIISIYYFFEYIIRQKGTTFKSKVIKLININLKVKHLIVLAVLAILGLYYVLRTGNFPILDIPVIEEKLRVTLEEILIVRPRFKEILIGHPALIVILFQFKQLRGNLGLYFLSLLALIGQINILNSFAHIHTPVLISLLRTAHGLWIGLIFGIIIVYVVNLVIKFSNKQKVK